MSGQTALCGRDKVNVLLVDDQPARLLTYEAVLGPLGQNLVRARSGNEALAWLMEMDFAVILLDVNMPGMDGFETATLIHQHPRFEKTPIIFVTGVHISDLDRLKGYELGAVDYVHIPVIPEILRSKVAVLVELYCKRVELETLNRSLEHANVELAAANRALEIEKARELQQLNANLEHANAELERADRRKDEFLATLAHELRNPLSPLQNALHILRLADGEPARIAHAQEIMERQMLQMVRLVDDLLDVSRITRGKLELRRESCNLGRILAAAAESARPMIEAAGQHLSIDLPDEDVVLDCDPQRLAQVFANLLNNASKYTERAGQITITTSRAPGWVTVTVKDDGIGIAPDVLDGVFDLFMQVDTSLERTRGGLGIGLTVVKRLVQMHGGRVEAHSEGEGRGSEFSVTLPTADVEARTASPASAAPRGDAPTAARRVLVVDDNVDAADTLAVSLHMLGHEVRTVYDPRQVVDTAATFLPQIVFMDVGMPRLNGFEVAKQIREHPWSENMVLVALTGWGQEEDRRKSHEAGFTHHLVKPAELADIQRLCELAHDHAT